MSSPEKFPTKRKKTNKQTKQNKKKKNFRKIQEEEAKKKAAESLKVQDYYVADVSTLYYTGFIEEEDKDTNIMFINELDKAGEQTVQIKCGTLQKLIERVTYHTNYGNKKKNSQIY